MKSLNYQEVIEDIKIRMNFFDKNRTFKNTTKELHGFDDTNDIEFVKKESNLTILTEEFVINENIENENVDKSKLASFVKNDDFYLEEVQTNIKKEKIDKKKETSSFFKSISNLFADNNHKKSKENNKSNVDKIIKFTNTRFETEISEPIIISKSLRETTTEIEIKAKKREAEEKLLNENTALETKNANVDFRKNKRKK